MSFMSKFQFLNEIKCPEEKIFIVKKVQTVRNRVHTKKYKMRNKERSKYVS